MMGIDYPKQMSSSLRLVNDIANVAMENKLYRHYKGNYYRVEGTCIHTETEEVLVVYRSLYTTEKYPYGQRWARPIKMWFDDVEGVPRFVEVDSIPV